MIIGQNGFKLPSIYISQAKYLNHIQRYLGHMAAWVASMTSFGIYRSNNMIDSSILRGQFGLMQKNIHSENITNCSIWRSGLRSFLCIRCAHCRTKVHYNRCANEQGVILQEVSLELDCGNWIFSWWLGCDIHAHQDTFAKWLWRWKAIIQIRKEWRRWGNICA